MDDGGVSMGMVEELKEMVVEALELGEGVVLLVGIPDLLGGRKGLLREMMREHAGLVSGTFWPPVRAAEGLVSEVVETNKKIREENARGGWRTPQLEAGIFNWYKQEGHYRLKGKTQVDGLHPTKGEQELLRGMGSGIVRWWSRGSCRGAEKAEQWRVVWSRRRDVRRRSLRVKRRRCFGVVLSGRRTIWRMISRGESWSCWSWRRKRRSLVERESGSEEIAGEESEEREGCGDGEEVR